MIRVDAVWLAVEPLDMRAGTESALARVVNVFGAARPHHAYLFANRRANRMKVLVHDGTIGAAQRHTGMFGVALTPGQTGFTLPVPNASKWPRGLACKGSNQLSCAIARDPEQAMAQASTADLIRRPRASGA